MRQVSVLVFFVVALSLATHGVEANLSLTLSNNTVYKSFLKNLRQQLTVGADKVYGIPVLNSAVASSQRFILIDLTNIVIEKINETITVAIDVENVQIVAYLTGNDSYFFPDAPRVAFQTLFSKSANQKTLNFSSSYEYLETAAGASRGEIHLGLGPFNSAISTLFHYDDNESLPKAFIVIFQMISEAARFKYIEQSVSRSIRSGNEFLPGREILNLENNWENLSALIQGSLTLQGLFAETILLFDSKDKAILIDSIYYPIVYTNVALLIYRCHYSKSNGNVAVPRLITMVGVERLPVDPCIVMERTVHIISGNGLCAEVDRNKTFDGAAVTLWKCKGKVNEDWTFKRDGTIQSLGKCMTVLQNDVVIFNCSLSETKTKIWEVSIDGTITNPSSGLVLTADVIIERNSLIVSANTNITGQSWRVGVNPNPIVASIIGFNDTCLVATAINGDKHIWVEDCEKNKIEQYWELQADGTIRVNTDATLCVATSGFKPKDVIVIKKCDDTANQRWVFQVDGTILNPKSGLVMAINEGNKSIILADPNKTADPYKDWLPFY